MKKIYSDAATQVGQRIRAERERLGVSQMHIAELAEMHFTSLGKIERGEANPSLTTMLRIAVALGVELSDLVRDLGAENLPHRAQGLTIQDYVKARQQSQMGGRSF